MLTWVVSLTLIILQIGRFGELSSIKSGDGKIRKFFEYEIYCYTINQYNALFKNQDFIFFTNLWIQEYANIYFSGPFFAGRVIHYAHEQLWTPTWPIQTQNAGCSALMKKAHFSKFQTVSSETDFLQQVSSKQPLPESKYFWKIGKTNKSTGNKIMNKFSYNSNAIWGKMRL